MSKAAEAPGDPLAFVESWQEDLAGRALPRDFFPVLHAIADYLRLSGQAARAERLLRGEAGMGVERWLERHLEHAQSFVLTLFESGKKEEARQVAAYFATRPYLFESMEKLGFFLFYRSLISLEEKDAAGLARCLTLMARTQAGMRDARLLRVIHRAGGLARCFAAAGKLGFSTRLLAAIFWGAQSLAAGGMVFGLIGRGLHFCLNMLHSIRRLRGLSQAWMLPRRARLSPARAGGKKDKRPVLVTRAMGGIGDILMMTPGLKALRRKYPDREIHFAVPETFHPLLLHNPDITLKDINAEAFYQEDYSALYNLTECPASRVESASLPGVKKNRIDIFSAAMGISGSRLNAVGRRPVYVVTEEERAWAERFFAEQGLAPKQCVAVQPFAAEPYKNYPHMRELVARLAETRPVLVFHNAPLQGFDHPQVFKIDGYSLRQSAALLALCRMLIAVDSALVHIAAALGRKTVALFGPTDGAVFTKHYPDCTVAHGYAEAGCKACWRNQGIVCGRTGAVQSRCLDSIPVENLLKRLC